MTSRDLWMIGLGAVGPWVLAVALGRLTRTGDTPQPTRVFDRVTPV